MEQQHQPQDPQKKKRVLQDGEEGGENRENEGGAARQYESGRNPEMQAQRSNRQGSGQTTQQRPEDR